MKTAAKKERRNYQPGLFMNFVAKMRKCLQMQGEQARNPEAYWTYVEGSERSLTQQLQAFTHLQQKAHE